MLIGDGMSGTGSISDPYLDLRNKYVMKNTRVVYLNIICVCTNELWKNEAIYKMETYSNKYISIFSIYKVIP